MARNHPKHVRVFGTLKQKAAEGQAHSKTLARVTTLPNRRQLLECACPSGAFSRLASTCGKSIKKHLTFSRNFKYLWLGFRISGLREARGLHAHDLVAAIYIDDLTSNRRR